MSIQRGFTGISFPFRFNSKGGVETSTTSVNDFTHIKESITQIILTIVGERVMELEFGSEIRSSLFKNLEEETDSAILKFYVEEAIKKFEKRVEVLNVEVIPQDEGEVIVDVDFLVKRYLKNDTVSIKLN